jgi:hypothetical protein
MDDQVLYVYKCNQCNYSGEVHLPGDEHDGAPYECKMCGANVFLEWDGGVTFDVGSPVEPVALAQNWRRRHGYVGRGGVVIVFNGAADGWVYKLRNAHHQQPGCIAVDEEGKTWTAIGGDHAGGALMWMPDDQIPDDTEAK